MKKRKRTSGNRRRRDDGDGQNRATGEATRQRPSEAAAKRRTATAEAAASHEKEYLKEEQNERDTKRDKCVAKASNTTSVNKLVLKA